MSKEFSDLVGLLIAAVGVLFFAWIIRSAMKKEAPPAQSAEEIARAAAARESLFRKQPLTDNVRSEHRGDAEPQNWFVAAQQGEAEQKTKLVRIAMGPIIGAILIANLITAVAVAFLYWLVK